MGYEMKNWAFLIALLAAPALQAETFTVNIPELQQEAKTVIQKLAGTLTGELKKAKEEGGAPAAITVCNTKAAGLTEQVNAESDWEIRRTSLKLRNPENAPDEWEKAALEAFDKKAKIGANPQLLTFSQVVVDEQGRKVFRMMKAIPVAEQCLGCHGAEVNPEIYQRIKTLYPTDQAIGFSEGDIRGAFSLKKYL